MLLAACAWERAEALTTLRLHADRIAFFYDRFLVEADGHVVVHTSDGMEIRGDAFSMDLKLNRFIVAGNVQVLAPGTQLSGAAFSDFLNFRRVYFIPILAEPDRWTFLNGDFAHPAKGREMPGDTFDFPDIGHRPDLVSRAAVIGANSYVRFERVTSNFFGLPVPLPAFYVSFAPTPALARNSLSGANLDLTYQFAGNANSISAVHLRYDATNHAYASIEQHLAGAHDYAVFSVNPLTAPAKFWNLMTGDTLSTRFQVDTFTQLYTYQYGLAEPLAAAQYTYITASEALPRWSIQGFANLTNFNLLGPGAHAVFANGQTVGELNHPSQVQITASSFQERIFGSPFYEQYFFGTGFNHDSYGTGLQQYGGVTYTTIWNQLVGFSVSLPELTFGNRNSAYDRYVLSGSFTKERQWYSVPHHVDVTTLVSTLSRQITRTVGVYAGYSIVNTGDYYLHGGYSISSPIINGVYAPGFEAFRGVATQRTFSFATNYTPSPEFTLSLLYRHHDDFPEPVPGLFPLPHLNPLGQYIYPSFLGQPPNDLTGDLHVRLAPHISVDIARTDYFGFATLKWSPTFIVQVSQ
ncbi:MAG TPA: hypothetical protein VIN40_09730 [Candidatus Tyrphobacter sp.]